MSARKIWGRYCRLLKTFLGLRPLTESEDLYVTWREGSRGLSGSVAIRIQVLLSEIMEVATQSTVSTEAQVVYWLVGPRRLALKRGSLSLGGVEQAEHEPVAPCQLGRANGR